MFNGKKKNESKDGQWWFGLAGPRVAEVRVADAEVGLDALVPAVVALVLIVGRHETAPDIQSSWGSLLSKKKKFTRKLGLV